MDLKEPAEDAGYPYEYVQPGYGHLYDMKSGISMQSADVTEVIESGVCGRESGYLELIDSFLPGAPRQIGLDFTNQYITIGRMSKDAVKADILFSSDFRRIGRMHARIERDGAAFYVIDLGSANHTALNGETLIPNVRYPLQPGAELTFTPSQPVRYRAVLSIP